jgi:hypothetical protein
MNFFWVQLPPLCLPMAVFGLVLVWRPTLRPWVIGLLYAALVAITTTVLIGLISHSKGGVVATALSYGVALAFVWAGFWLWHRHILPREAAFAVALLSVPALLVTALGYACSVDHACL